MGTEMSVLKVASFSMIMMTIGTLNGNRTIRRQTNLRSVKWRTGQLADYSQLAETFDLKSAVNNCCKCDVR